MPKFQPLSTQIEHVRSGQPLPFGICDAAGRLLLARGQTIHSQSQLDGLLDRGAYVWRDPNDETLEKINSAKAHELPPLWSASTDRLRNVLEGPIGNQFESALESASHPVLALIKRDPDQAILQVVRPEEGPVSNYSHRHAFHAAITGHLAAQRLGWGADAEKSIFRAALTMNLSMSELQNHLSSQVTPLTALQRKTIHEHPRRGAELLQAAGINDPMWIEAVARHHERPDGKGYPGGLSDVSELAMLLNRVDVLTAKFSARAVRPAQEAGVAVRQFYAADSKSPITAAIVKEFGLYPPGCSVRLKSGELGIAIRRGGTATTPLVAVVIAPNGEHLKSPVKRNSAQAEHSVVAVLPNAALKVRLPMDRLIQACAD